MQEQLDADDVQKILRGEHVAKRPLKAIKTIKQLAKGAKRHRGTMNKTEARYAAELESRLRAGKIRWYEFEAIKVRLADNTFLTPDFAVVADDGFLELHDVKGRKGDSYWCEEDAKVKLKVVAERFPSRVKIVWEDKSGGWNEEQL